MKTIYKIWLDEILEKPKSETLEYETQENPPFIIPGMEIILEKCPRIIVSEETDPPAIQWYDKEKTLCIDVEIESGHLDVNGILPEDELEEMIKNGWKYVY